MAKEIKLFNNLDREVPALKKDVVLRTKSGVYYAWKGEELEKSNSSQEIINGLKAPLIIEQTGNDYVCVLLDFEDGGDYISVFKVFAHRLKVNDFKDKNSVGISTVPAEPRQSAATRAEEFRFYKDRKVLRVEYVLFRDGTYIRGIQNPQYVHSNRWGENWGRFGAQMDASCLNAAGNAAILNEVDDYGHRHYLIEGEVNLDDLAVEISKTNKKGFSPSCFKYMDASLGRVHNVLSYDSESLILSERTRDMIRKFYEDSEKEVLDFFKQKHPRGIETMEDLIEFCASPTPKAAKTQLLKMENTQKRCDDLFAKLSFNREGQGGLVFDREGDKIFATRVKYSEYYYNSGDAILVFDVKTKKKELYVKVRGEQPKKLIPSLDSILKWFEYSPSRDWYRNELTGEWVSNFIPNPPVLYLKDGEEIFQGTNVEALEKCDPILKSWSIVSCNNSSAFEGTKTVQELVKHCVETFWAVLFGDNIIEQLIKAGMPLLALTKLRGDNFIDQDVTARRWKVCGIGFHGKGKNLKDCFNLSINQLRLVEQYITQRLAEGNKDIVPNLYKADSVLGAPLNRMSQETFKEVMGFPITARKFNQWSEFSWYMVSQETNLVKLLTSKMKLKDFISWYNKGWDFNEYEDYLTMRESLKKYSVEANRPDLFSEVAFPIKAASPEVVKTLHDEVSKVYHDYKDKAKIALFDKAVKEAKSLEFEDKKLGLCVVSPEQIKDVPEEGRALHHCLTGPVWIDKIAERKSVILFIRRIADKKKSFFSVELTPDGSIRQCHGLQNCNPTEEVIQFLRHWADAKKGICKESIRRSYSLLCAPR